MAVVHTYLYVVVDTQSGMSQLKTLLFLDCSKNCYEFIFLHALSFKIVTLFAG